MHFECKGLFSEQLLFFKKIIVPYCLLLIIEILFKQYRKQIIRLSGINFQIICYTESQMTLSPCPPSSAITHLKNDSYAKLEELQMFFCIFSASTIYLTLKYIRYTQRLFKALQFGVRVWFPFVFSLLLNTTD